MARPPPPTEFAKQKSAAAQSKARAESGAALGSHAPTDKDRDRASLKSEREHTAEPLTAVVETGLLSRATP